MAETKRDWLALAATLPADPGVYLFKGADDEIIYVGKAKSLTSRVRSYFLEGSGDYRAFIHTLAHELEDLETIVTRSEKEALILERELIRRHEPKYNVIWRDDKQYLCLRVDPTHDYPWVQVVRNMGRDGARYFGPFHSASAARQTLRVVNRHFQLRTCRDSVLYNRDRPCLEYQIGRCPAPCVFDVDRQGYKGHVDDALMFLEGKGRTLVGRLQKRMYKAADGLEFEVAARVRDQIRAVEKTLERQHAALASMRDQDVLGVFRNGDDLCIAVVEVRDGRVRDVRSHLFVGRSFEERDLLESFLLQFYAHRTDIPAEVIVPFDLDGAEALGELLAERRGKRVLVHRPQRGERVRVLELARDNAEHAYYERGRKDGAMRSTLEALAKRLMLPKVPMTIECFDISNFQGKDIVASKVAFRSGLPDKRRYRRYKVKTTEGQDDFGAIYEVLSRRIARGMTERDLPDLLVVDGGKGQLHSAKAAMDDLGLVGPSLVALAKSRVVGHDTDDSTTRSSERVFLVGVKDPILLHAGRPETRLMSAIRDEAHRFAITFHRKVRSKRTIRSELDEIPGIGPARRKALLSSLGSVKRIKAASEAELAAVKGVGRAAAKKIHGHFHGLAPELSKSHS